MSLDSLLRDGLDFFYLLATPYTETLDNELDDIRLKSIQSALWISLFATSYISTGVLLKDFLENKPSLSPYVSSLSTIYSSEQVELTAITVLGSLAVFSGYQVISGVYYGHIKKVD